MFLKVPKNTRYEIKFVTYEHNYYSIINWIKLHELNFKREYSSRFVNNIYFDSPSYNSFKSNIYGDSSRIKLRYRWYEKLQDPSQGSFEIKFKRNLYGWKRRFKIKELNFKDNNDWKSFCRTICKNLPEEEKIFFKFNLNPQIINQYQRDYFVTSDNKLRITVDKKHDIYDQRYSSYPNLNKKTLNQRVLIMEFKFDRKERARINKLMNYIPMRSSRNSKYVNSIRAVSGF
ncbi:VTC domain-containing protein [Pelagibacteraceae bacterium]|nr:VTC domain-containing protein [Pelagibacteraceae bacterium]